MATNKLALKLLINAKDRASSVFDKLRSNAGKVAGAIAGYFGVRFFKSAIDDAEAFEKQMDTVAAVSNATAEDLKKLEQAAKEMGATTQYTALESAQALESLARAGLSASEQIQALPEVLSLAQANGIGLAESASFITTAIKGMGLQFSDVGRVADVLTKAAASANTSVTGLGSGLSYAAPLAQDLGLSLESTVSYLAQLANAGIDASRAGTSLNAMMVQFQNPASKFRKELGNLGIQTDDFNLALKQLAEKGDDGKAAILALGTEAGPALQALLNQGMPALEALQQGLNNSAGAAKKAADTMSDNLTGIKRQFGSVVDAIKLQFSQPILEPFKNTIKSVSNTLQSLLNDGSIARFGQSMAASFTRAVENGKLLINKIDEIYTRLSDNGVIGTYFEQIGNEWESVYNLVSTVGDLFTRLFSILADTTSTTTFGDALSAVLIKIVESVTFLVNAFATGLTTIETLFHVIAGSGASFFSSIMTGIADIESAFASLTFGDVSDRWALEAERSRKIAESFAESYRSNFKKAEQALQATAKNAEATNQSMLVLSGGLITTSKSIDKVSESSGKAKEKTDELSDSIKKIGDQAAIAESKTREVDNAFKNLGITSSQALKQAAKNARADYLTIRDSGVASAEDIANAWQAYMKTAEAANKGVLDKSKEVEKQQYKVGEAAKKTGDQMSTAYNKAEKAIDGVIEKQREAENNKGGHSGKIPGYDINGTKPYAVYRPVKTGRPGGNDPDDLSRASRRKRVQENSQWGPDGRRANAIVGKKFNELQQELYSQLSAESRDKFARDLNKEGIEQSKRAAELKNPDVWNKYVNFSLQQLLKQQANEAGYTDDRNRQVAERPVYKSAGKTVNLNLSIAGKEVSGSLPDDARTAAFLNEIKRAGLTSA